MRKCVICGEMAENLSVGAVCWPCGERCYCDECGVIHDEENELMTIKEESNV
jgi:hypothetical protein